MLQTVAHARSAGTPALLAPEPALPEVPDLPLDVQAALDTQLTGLTPASGTQERHSQLPESRKGTRRTIRTLGSLNARYRYWMTRVRSSVKV